MRHKLLLGLSLTLLASSVLAQITVNTDGFGRYQINDYLATPTFASGSWGPGTGTFGFNPGGTGSNTWAQFLQFDIQGNEAGFNSATGFSLSLAPDFANGGRSFSIYANAGNNDIAGAGAGFNLINNTTGVSGSVALGGTAIMTGSTSGGAITISNDFDLNSYLGSVDFNSNRYVYFTFWGDTSSTAGGTVDLSGSTLATVSGVTAVPEPSTYALLAGFMAVGLVMVRRRIRQG